MKKIVISCLLGGLFFCPFLTAQDQKASYQKYILPGLVASGIASGLSMALYCFVRPRCLASKQKKIDDDIKKLDSISLKADKTRMADGKKSIYDDKTNDYVIEDSFGNDAVFEIESIIRNLKVTPRDQGKSLFITAYSLHAHHNVFASHACLGDQEACQAHLERVKACKEEAARISTLQKARKVKIDTQLAVFNRRRNWIKGIAVGALIVGAASSGASLLYRPVRG